jgi:hypothetical protein
MSSNTIAHLAKCKSDDITEGKIGRAYGNHRTENKCV